MLFSWSFSTCTSIRLRAHASSTRRFRLGLLLLTFLLAACNLNLKPTPDPNLQIQQAVAATLAAIPQNTPVPVSTPYPTPTPITIQGLFCEYEFCIGHPPGMAFYDHLAAQNPVTPSEYKSGWLVAYQIPGVVINVIWLQAAGTSDPQFLLDTILDDQADTKTGNVDVQLIHNMNTIYTPITTTISPNVPFGGAGAWVCGDRVFAWKVYSPTAETARPLFDEALNRFTCNQNQ